MLLNQIKNFENYVYCERYINNFKKVANEVHPYFCAITGPPNFFLPYLEFNKSAVEILLANPDKKILKEIVCKDKVRFFVHPDSLNEIESRGDVRWEVIAEPTSSVRTVIAKDKGFMIKMHLNRRLSRFIRRLRPSSVEHSLLISEDIEKSLSGAPSTFGFLPETIGIVWNECGAIIRENTPRPFVNDKRFLLPFFSLYSTDLKDKQHRSFFQQMVEKSKQDPLNFFIEKIIEPLFANICYFIRERGILLEAHGQNVLVELNENLEITRLIHRDFQSMYVDKEIRNSKKLDCKFKKHIMGDESPREVSYSLVYDQYIGKYVLDNFVDLINSVWKIAKEQIEDEIRAAFKKYFDDAWFPKEGFYIMGKETFRDNVVAFQKIDERPRYR